MQKWIGSTMVWFSLALTLSLFVLAKLDQGTTVSLSWLTVSQLLSLVGTTLLAISFLLTSRFRFIESWFGGIDKVYKIHHVTGGIAFVLLIHHPLFLAVNVLPNVSQGWKYFWFSSLWSYNFGIAALYIMFLMLVLTLLINLPYSMWKKTHELMGLGLLMADFHVLTISSDVSRYMPLRWWFITLLMAASMAVIYKKFLYYWIGPRYQYLVEKIEHRGDVLLIQLRPELKKQKYWGGQFVFVSFESLGKEQHPFSLASSPDQEIMQLGVKVLGDYTLRMKDIKPMEAVTIWGPYGSFYETTQTRKDLVWIAGGIGITPFLSMLPRLVSENHHRRIDIFYCVSNEGEMVYKDEIKEIIGNDQKIRLWEFCSNERGRITAKAVLEAVESLAHKKIMLCGPSGMMESLTLQFKALGIKNKDIIFEDFNFK